MKNAPIEVSMTRNELITNIASKTKQSKVVCESVIDAFTEEIKDCLVNGDKILLKGFMSFEVIERGERDGKNLNTGDPITYPPVKSIKCRPSKAFKDAINER